MPENTMIFDEIIQLQQAQSKMIVLQEQLSKLLTPTLNDVELLPKLFTLAERLNEGKNLREWRHSFVFVAVYLYSPSAIIGNRVIQPGICAAIGGATGCCRQVVSQTFYQAKCRYLKLKIFRDQTDNLLYEISKFLTEKNDTIKTA